MAAGAPAALPDAGTPASRSARGRCSFGADGGLLLCSDIVFYTYLVRKSRSEL
jgi:predicted histidine transporter YuiF (NhaC family)